jgi:hypothetical protein
MIGRIPAVLKMNKQTNHANCFLVPDFHRAIPFQIISRMTRITKTMVIHIVNMKGADGAPYKVGVGI